jgi:hypothetical protein
MAIIHNKWVEKVKIKKGQETAPAYESYAYQDDFATQTRTPKKRHTPSLQATFIKTLRGVRK